MKPALFFHILFLTTAFYTAIAIEAPTGLVIFSGDKSVILHWEPNSESNLAGYNVYRAFTNGGPFVLQNTSLLTTRGYCDLSVGVVDGKTNFYQVTAVTTTSQESLPSSTVSTVPNVFASNDAFLDYVQQANFDYFWYTANPANGLIPDRMVNSSAPSACSIAAVGFGLTAIGIGADHGWITRTQAVARVLTTLNTFLTGPQGTNTTGIIGYQGWFYHFLDINAATRSSGSELSSIDTTLLVSGILYAKQYFNGTNVDETSIRSMADAIFNGVNWTFMAQGTDRVAMGWQPTTGFSGYGNWVGYDEGMILYLLGLGTTTNPLPATAWSYWTGGYTWATYYGESFVPFPPLFGHEYSHCWIDFRHIADAYMNGESSSYFENSRRAALAQQSYCIADPLGWVGYSSNVWGLTACDGPAGYAARGAPPALNDDGTIAPTAPGGAMAFTPAISLPALQYFYSHFRTHIWTAFGFRDAFNLSSQWYDTDELGIDQGPIVIMIENYRTQRPWQLFMQNAEIQRGLQQAGFVSLPFIALNIQALPAQSSFTISWAASAGTTYNVEYSTNLDSWFAAPNGEVIASGSAASWTDGAPLDAQRFYRVFQFASP
jgi:hypothetical protein